MAHFTPENRFHRNLTEITELELLRAIRVEQQDADAARAELYSRGWTAAHIEQAKNGGVRIA